MKQLSQLYWAARERIRTVFLRTRAEADMDEEVRFHLEMEADKIARAEGVSRVEARRRAGVAFGGVERFKEDVRDARGLDWLAGTRLDFALGLRMLVKYPALTIVGGLGIAVGIAVSVGFFTFITTNINPKLPLDDGDRIVALENRDIAVNNEDRRVVHDFLAWRSGLRSVKEISAFRNIDRNLRIGDAAGEPVKIAEMTAAGFRVARVAPMLGRYLVDDDERIGAPFVLVIGYNVWQHRFAGDTAILGREVRLDGRPYTIVGVMPKDFRFPMSHEHWTAFRPNPNAFGQREGPGIYVFGRLAYGVTIQQAQAELDEVGRRATAEFPKTHATLRPMVMPYVHSLTDIQGITTMEVVTMQLMVSMLLVVVALNVAVLIYARTAMRAGEIAVRTALGASRRRVVTQLFIEALVLSTVAAAVGLAIAQVGVRLGNGIYEVNAGGKLFWADYGLQPLTVLFTIGIAVVTAAIVGVLPALQVTGKRLQNDIRQMGGGTGMRLGKTWTVLIVAQVAIAVAALPAAANMGWGEVRNSATQPTYPAEEFIVAGLGMEFTDSIVDASTKASRFDVWVVDLLRRLEAQPEVAHVTYEAALPGRGAYVQVEGAPPPAGSAIGHRVRSSGVGVGYFGAFSSRILAGRGFQPADADTASTAVIVSQSFVRQVLGGGNALGRRVRFAAQQERAAADTARPGRWFEIVGVTSDMQVNRVDPTVVRPAIWYAVAPSQAHLALWTEVGARLRKPTTAADFVPKLRQIAASVDPVLRLGRTYSLVELEKESQLALRLVGLAVGLTIVSVFLLSAAGVYALTSFTVTRRRREIGIRSALGAHPRQVLRGIFGGVARQITVGLALGVAAAIAIEMSSGGELMGGRGRLFLPVFGGLMAVVAIVGALGPARRGLRIAPTEALRSEA